MRAGDRPVAGVLACVFALLAFALQDTLVRGLNVRYPILEVLTLRSTVVVAIMLVAGLAVRGRHVFTSAHASIMLLRGVVAFVAFTTYYLALTRIPLADAAAVFMTAPLFVTAWSAWLLGERVGAHRWGAVIAGFAAVVFMLNPDADAIQAAAVLPILTAITYAFIPILTRRYGVREHPMTMALYSVIGYLAACLVVSAAMHLLPMPAIPASDGGLVETLRAPWRAMAAPDIALTVLVACFFALGLLGMTQAYRIAQASTVAPFEYSYLVWAIVLGYVVFAEVPSTRTLLGSAAVVACGCYILFRERRAAESA